MPSTLTQSVILKLNLCNKTTVELYNKQIYAKVQLLISMISKSISKGHLSFTLSRQRSEGTVDRDSRIKEKRPEIEKNRYCFVLLFLIVSYLLRTKTINVKQNSGFGPGTSALPVRYSTNWAMKPHIGSEVNLLSSYLPWGVKWCEVYEVIHFWTAVIILVQWDRPSRDTLRFNSQFLILVLLVPLQKKQEVLHTKSTYY